MNGMVETMTQVGRFAHSFVRTAVPSPEIREGRYLVRFARTPEELDAALRLRFEVFNLELGEGLTSSYVSYKCKRYLFGYCSLTSQDVNEGWRVMELLRTQGHLHPCLFVPPNPGYECEANDLTLVEAENVKLPRLFQTYLRYGAKVCSPPAIDRQFKTIDFLVLFDIAKMSERTVRMFFQA